MLRHHVSPPLLRRLLALGTASIVLAAPGAAVPDPGALRGVELAGAVPVAEVPAVEPPAVEPPSCAVVAAGLSRREQVGQLMMVAVSSGGMTSGQARTLSRVHAGSVLLLGNSTAGRVRVRRLSSKVHGLAGRPDGVGILLAVDQEGGTVQRLRGPGFDRIPSAREQATWSRARLTSRAERWGRQLRAAGVDADLAPVADVVPRSLERVNQPIGVLRRGYGPKPDVVAAKVRAVVSGMDRAQVATAVKHYPGLGRVRGNTDFVRTVVDRTTTRHDRALRGFRAGAAAGADMIMVSSARYTKIDARRRAVFSPVVLKSMLREDLGYGGVIISDDLTAPGFRDHTPSRRAVLFLRAGGDLMIVGDAAKAARMAAAVRARAATDARFRTELSEKVTRVLQLKARRGLTSCR